MFLDNFIPECHPTEEESQAEQFAEYGLTEERFNKIIGPVSANEKRPFNNADEIIKWCWFSYGYYLTEHMYVSASVQNVIPVTPLSFLIDGIFLKFAEDQNIKISCLHQDLFSSSSIEDNLEMFTNRGVFLIETSEFKFISASLFHTGVQNSHEPISFLLINKSDYFKYIKLRDSFFEWRHKRERTNNHVYVAGGNETITYTKDLGWDDLFLPETLKKDIRLAVEGWLAAKDIYKKAKVPWKRGVLLYGAPGCGKTSLIKTIIAQYDFKPVTIQVTSNTDAQVLAEAFEYAHNQVPSLLYIEDIDTLFNESSTTLSHFLNLMDGIGTNAGIFVIGTANNLSLLKESVIDRPSRFDRKWEIPLPCEEMTFKYLQKWFSEYLEDEILRSVSKQTHSNKFSYVYLKELYLTSVFNALAEGREKPLEDDLKKALVQMTHDKKKAKSGFAESSTRKIGLM